MNRVKRFVEKVHKRRGIIYTHLAHIIGYNSFGALRIIRLKRNSYLVGEEELIRNRKIDISITAKNEWDALNEDHNNKVFEDSLCEKLKKMGTERIIIPGKCPMCGADHGFIGYISDNDSNNHREAFACVSCSRLRRERAVIELVRNLYEDGKKDIFIYEAGENFRFIRSFAHGTVGSEYLSSEYKSGDVVNGILHEDANELSFQDNSFDVVVSRDVFEHLSDPKRCLREAFRVLRRGACASSLFLGILMI